MITRKDMGMFKEGHRVLLRANDFICLRPHPGLQAYIASYNITFPTSALIPAGFTEMPCACATLTIGSTGRDLFITLDGPTTKPRIVGPGASRLAMFITIECRPAGLYALTGIPQNELADESIPFETISPGLGKALAGAVEKAASIAGLAAALDGLLLENMASVFYPQLPQTLQSIARHGGNISVKRLSEDIHYSERQLNRIFTQQVGVSAKTFSRLVRINSAFRLLKNPGHSLVLVSDQLGYHDPSHFIHDFRLACGISPKAYRENMSDFYNNTGKF